MANVEIGGLEAHKQAWQGNEAYLYEDIALSGVSQLGVKALRIRKRS